MVAPPTDWVRLIIHEALPASLRPTAFMAAVLTGVISNATPMPRQNWG